MVWITMNVSKFGHLLSVTMDHQCMALHISFRLGNPMITCRRVWTARLAIGFNHCELGVLNNHARKDVIEIIINFINEIIVFQAKARTYTRGVLYKIRFDVFFRCIVEFWNSLKSPWSWIRPPCWVRPTPGSGEKIIILIKKSS